MVIRYLIIDIGLKLRWEEVWKLRCGSDWNDVLGRDGLFGEDVVWDSWRMVVIMSGGNKFWGGWKVISDMFKMCGCVFGFGRCGFLNWVEREGIFVNMKKGVDCVVFWVLYLDVVFVCYLILLVNLFLIGDVVICFFGCVVFRICEVCMYCDI